MSKQTSSNGVGGFKKVFTYTWAFFRDIAGTFALAAVYAVAYSYVIMGVWNDAVSYMFSLPDITFFQAFSVWLGFLSILYTIKFVFSSKQD